MNAFIFFLLGLGYVCLLIWGFFLARNHSFLYLANVLLLVIVGLVYDNLIIALGRFIGEGSELESLSYGRFWLHALFTPTLILFAWNVCFRTGLQWAKKTLWKVLAYLMTIGLILYELLTSVMGLELKPIWKNGVLTYESAGQSVSPFMVILVTLVLGIVGLILLIKLHFFWLFICTLIMVSGGILSIWIENFPIMNVLEFLLIVSLLMIEQFLLRDKKQPYKYAD